MQDLYFHDETKQFRIVDLGNRFALCSVWFDEGGRVTGFEDKPVSLETEKPETYELIARQIARASELAVLDVKELRKVLYEVSDPGISYLKLLKLSRELSEQDATFKVQVDQLAQAMFQGNDLSEVECYLDRESGMLIQVSDYDMEQDEFEPDDEKYIEIESAPSAISWQMMEDFVGLLSPSSVKDKLAEAIHGQKPSRRFKDTLQEDDEIRQCWYSYEQFRQAEYVLNCLAEEELKVEYILPDSYNIELKF